jgi:hypothetical protein
MRVRVDATPADLDITTPVRKLRTNATGRAAAVASGRMTPAAADRYTQRAQGVNKPPSKWDAREFVAWDGEGIADEHGRHRYVMLVNSLGDALVDRNGVGTHDALRMLLDCAETHPQAVHVIFAGSYDVNMILSPVLTRHQAMLLGEQGHVTLWLDGHRYRITYHPRHTFEVREEVWNPAKGKCDRIRYVCLWDVFGSFQASFVKACQRTLSADELADLDRIIDMKGKRGEFTADDMDEMLTYCRAELRALIALVTHDRDNFAAAGFRATRWDGAGAKASAVLSAKKVGDHKRKLDEELRVPVRAAYAGGRIEQYRFGHHDGDLLTIDIRSAYPWAATFLPSLHAGEWERVGVVDADTIKSDEFAVWLVNYRGTHADDLHPFFWRAPDGAICYPQMTEGWYWSPEVAAAHAAGHGALRILDGWRFRPATAVRPFSFVPELYEARRHLEANRKGRGWPLKLALNSLYGKMAQQVGGSNGRAPRWHQLEWAGWITSKCRATMYALASQNVDRLVSIQTDGVTFTGTHLPTGLGVVGDKLGQYEVERFDAGTFVQSGIYWLHDTDGWHDPKVRGVGAGVLVRDVFAAMWSRGDFGSVPVDVTRFRGMVTSCLTEERWQDWCQWITEPRDIAAAPAGKRIHQSEQCLRCQTGTPGMGLHVTLPTGGGCRSSLHKVAWETGRRGLSDEWWLDALAEDDE